MREREESRMTPGFLALEMGFPSPLRWEKQKKKQMWVEDGKFSFSTLSWRSLWESPVVEMSCVW